MKWEKKGVVLQPKKSKFWNQKYCILPTPLFLEKNGAIRIYYGTTDNSNFGRISFVDVNMENPSEILYEHDDYILDVGQDGTFDDCGVVPSCAIEVGQLTFLYTVGFQRTFKTPYMLFAGLATSSNQFDFKRASQAPILPRSQNRHISQGAPCVIFDGGIYKMWHWFATKWVQIDGKPFMDYHIGYAESHDGLYWKMNDVCCLAPRPEKNEFAVARPWVFKIDSTYHMYFSTRYQGRLYRIDYAVSTDGINWKRDLPAPFDVSDSGWDSEMICYPSIVKANEHTFMFYNGNNNGETGFGYAELVSD